MTTENQYHHLRYLLLFYLFPTGTILRARLHQFPRTPLTVRNSPKWRKVYHSQMFEAALAEGCERLVWPYFGIRSAVTSYTVNDPLRVLARDYETWLRVLEILLDDSAVYLLEHEQNTFHFRYFKDVLPQFERMVRTFRATGNFDAVREIVLHNRCHEDFAATGSNDKIEFYRKYNHSRTKAAILGLDKQPDNIVHPFDVEDRMAVQDFLSGLPQRDRLIVELLHRGYRLVEIADMLGYANHSGVSKRVAHIRKQWQSYQTRTSQPPSAKPKPAIRYDTIPFAYKRA